MRVHLDTDLGGDPDDVCALVMLLGWPGVEVVGVTTTLDAGGFRAAYVRHVLDLLGRRGIPVAAGAEQSLSHHEVALPVIDDERYWPAGITPTPGPIDAALDLLGSSAHAGATLVAIGPLTNVALLPHDVLAGTAVVAMGGWVEPAREGLPQWGPERDFNVQWDVQATVEVAAVADLTLATLPATMQAWITTGDLDDVRATGRAGVLIAAQTEAHAADTGKGALALTCAGLPEGFLNFHYDPVACAVAVGWPGAVVDSMRLTPVVEGGVLHWRPGGRETRVLRGIDPGRFRGDWLGAVAQASPGSRLLSGRAATWSAGRDR